MVAGMRVAVAGMGVAGVLVGTGVDVGIVNWAVQTGPGVIFVHGMLGIVSV